MGSLLTVGIWIGRTWAAGIPDDADALTYAGTIEKTDGTPIAGTPPIDVYFFGVATPTPGTMSLCNGSGTSAGGYFAVKLPKECTAAVRGAKDIWIDVRRGWRVRGGITKVGAVPYAVEAGHATSADSAATANAGGALAQQLVPSGAVMAFNLATCPAGWTPLAAAQGRVIVGVGPGLTLGTAVGADGVTLTLAQLPAHTHAISDPGHQHNPLDANNFLTAGGAGMANVALGSAFNITAVTSMAKTGILATQSAGSGQYQTTGKHPCLCLFCQKS